LTHELTLAEETGKLDLKLALRYLIAAIAVALATLLRLWGGRTFVSISPFVIFYPTVLLVLYIAGSGPGVFAAALSVLAADYVFLQPRGSLAISTSADVLQLGIFTGTNVFICGFAHRLQRSRAEAAVAHQTEQRFRTMIDTSYQLAWTARADGYIDWYNQRWYDYTGLTPEDIEGWGWQKVHDPLMLKSVLERWNASIATGKPFEMVFPLRGADGRFHSFLTRVQPRKDAQGNVLQWYGTNTDIEELKRADDAQVRLASIVESTDDAILSKRVDGTVLTWNSGAERLFGYSADEIVGKTILLLVPPDRVEEETGIIGRLRRGERCDHIETVRLTRDGRRIDVSVTISPLKDRDGNIVGASKIARDITDRKRSEEALAVAMRAAEEANKTKDRFIAVLSHELRTR
jgi:PAS domain S-box-containing protein